MFKNRTILVLSLIMLVNALAYGTIIPLLYPYAQRFGITPFTLSMLFTSFAFFQFISTPIIGRLSDRHGRKPLLVISLAGTSLALVLFASAQSVIMLFISRIIDGITGGNISVAQAVIADTTEGKERTQAFGILGASFGFGFLVGPAMGGVLSQISLTTPFWFASILALIATVATAVFLKETLKPNKKKVHTEPLIRFDHIAKALFTPLLGGILLVSLLQSIALNSFIIGFQSSTVDVLKMSAKDIGLIFTAFGLVNILMQSIGIKLLFKVMSDKKHILMSALAFSSVLLGLLFFARHFYPFVMTMIIFAIVSSPPMPMITSLLSERVKKEDQGAALGINQSYVSLGQVAGPLLAGLVTTLFVPGVFLLSGGVTLLAFFAATILIPSAKKKFDL